MSDGNVESNFDVVERLAEAIDLTRWESLEAMMISQWNVDPADPVSTIEDVKEVGLELENGEVITLTPREFLDQVAETHCYGWANTKRRTAHWWASEQADPKLMAMVIGHEVGHLMGTPAEDDAQEEDRANEYAVAALLAARPLLAQLARQEQEIGRLRSALIDAICSPIGVIPSSAMGFLSIADFGWRPTGGRNE